MKKEHFLFIDILKILAIVLIVYFHFIYELNPDNSIRYIGFIGASLFFIISGFELANSNPDLEKFNLRWFLKRFVKITSFYYIALLIILILFYNQSFSGNILGNLFSHFLFIDSYFDLYSYGIISPAWFITPLIVLYLIFPYLNRILKVNWLFFVFIFLLTFVFRYNNGNYTSFNFIFFLLEFSFGILFAYGKRYSILFISLLISIVNIYMPVSFLIFFIFSSVFKNKITLKSISFVSQQTIIVFLYHEALVYLIFKKWSIYGLNQTISIIFYLISLIPAIFISYYIQKKIVKSKYFELKNK